MENKETYFKIEDDRDISFFADVSRIYECIDDSVSKDIFSNCLLYSLTDSPVYVRRNIDLIEAGRRFGNLLADLSAKHPFIYGAGARGKRLASLYPEIEWGGFCDRNVAFSEVNGLPVVRPSEIARMDRPVVVSNLLGYADITDDLSRMGIPADQIICLENWNKEAEKQQYFEGRCIGFAFDTYTKVQGGGVRGLRSLRRA